MKILPQPKKISGIRYKDSYRFLLIMKTLFRRNPLIFINWIQKRSSNPKLVKLHIFFPTVDLFLYFIKKIERLSKCYLDVNYCPILKFVL
jgi:hypothetical protein